MCKFQKALDKKGSPGSLGAVSAKRSSSGLQPATEEVPRSHRMRGLQALVEEEGLLPKESDTQGKLVKARKRLQQASPCQSSPCPKGDARPPQLSSKRRSPQAMRAKAHVLLNIAAQLEKDDQRLHKLQRLRANRLRNKAASLRRKASAADRQSSGRAKRQEQPSCDLYRLVLKQSQIKAPVALARINTRVWLEMGSTAQLVSKIAEELPSSVASAGPDFVWTSRNKRAQSFSFITHIKSIIHSGDTEWVDAAQDHPQLLSHEGGKRLGFTFKGTTDLMATTKRSAGGANWPRKGMRLLMDIKPHITRCDIHQAQARLVLGNIHSPESRPVMVVTDLNDEWHAMWLDGSTIYQHPFASRGRAVGFIEDLLAGHFDTCKVLSLSSFAQRHMIAGRLASQPPTDSTVPSKGVAPMDTCKQPPSKIDEEQRMVLLRLMKQEREYESVHEIASTTWLDALGALGLRKIRALSHDMRPLTKPLQDFKWDDREYFAQSDRFIPYIKTIISLGKEGTEWVDAARDHPDLLSLFGMETFRHNFTATTDLLVSKSLAIRAHRPEKGAQVLFDIRKEVTEAHSIQAEARLVLANLHAPAERPVMVLTDLCNKWQLMWMDDINVHECHPTRPQAVKVINNLLAGHTQASQGSILATIVQRRTIAQHLATGFA